MATVAWADVEINETNFPDENFRNWVLSQEYGADGVLTNEERAIVKEIKVDSMNIQSLKGIEFFTALTSLNCFHNQLTALDVSKNTALTELFCHGNQLTTLDVSQNTALTLMACAENPLTALDVSKNNALTRLWCYKTTLTTLDVSGCTALWSLNCYDNQLKTLDVSGCTALLYLYCFNNQLTTLDVSGCTTLSSLYCYNNQLTTLDVSGCTELWSLSCYNNQLTTLDVSKNTKLSSLDCYQNQIKDEGMDALVESLPTVSLTRNMRVIYNENEGNVMTVAQVLAAIARSWVPVCYDGNQWQEYGGDPTTYIKISKNNFPDANFRAWLLSQSYGADGKLSGSEIAGVTSIDVNGKSIQSLKGIELFSMLIWLYCKDNQLTTLDVSKNTRLGSLYCQDNQLTTLDLSACTKLTSLDCRNNQLTTLDVSGCTKLTKLDCYNNQLTTLEVSGCTKLTWLHCYNNQLTTLDVSGCTALWSLYCYNNQLTTLDVSGCTALEWLYCYDNQLTTLDVKKCTKLEYLDCYQNRIKGEAMDVLVKNLPTVSNGTMYVIYIENEQNKMTKDQVAIAKAKGWIPHYYNGFWWYEYPGSEPVSGMEVDASNFPDENFRSWVLSQPYGADEVLTEEEIAEVKIINVQDKGIKDLKGIENFKALTWLMCGKNQLTTLDVSDNTELEYLWCFGNQLTELNVSENTSLTGLWCGVNQLTSLDVSKNTELTRLDCSQNQLMELDVTKNAALEKLFCSDNQLTTLDVSQCPELTLLWCNNNKLSALNVMGCAALTDIFCYKNQITDTDMDVLVEGLPIVDSGKIYVVCGVDEQNDMTTIQVAAAKAKGWTPICLDMSDGWVEYSDDAPGYYPGIGNCREYLGSEPNPDGIVSPFMETEDGAIIYDLSGRRISKMQRGVNIVNGRKVLK